MQTVFLDLNRGLFITYSFLKYGPSPKVKQLKYIERQPHVFNQKAMAKVACFQA